MIDLRKPMIHTSATQTGCMEFPERDKIPSQLYKAVNFMPNT